MSRWLIRDSYTLIGMFFVLVGVMALGAFVGLTLWRAFRFDLLLGFAALVGVCFVGFVLTMYVEDHFGKDDD